MENRNLQGKSNAKWAKSKGKSMHEELLVYHRDISLFKGGGRGGIAFGLIYRSLSPLLHIPLESVCYLFLYWQGVVSLPLFEKNIVYSYFVFSA
jgi:hypothetical protein